MRLVIVAALLVTGLGQVLALWGIGSEVRFDLDQPTTALTRFQLIHLVVEAVAGVMVVIGAVLIAAVGRHRIGWTVAYFGLLILLTLADLISFYVRQFDSIAVVLGHAVLLAAVVVYRDELRAEDRGQRPLAEARPAD